MSTRQISLNHFAAHCVEEINAVQQGNTILELLRGGRIVAVVSPSPEAPVERSLFDWMGSGAALMTYGPGYDAAKPAFDAGDWEAFQDDAG